MSKKDLRTIATEAERVDGTGIKKPYDISVGLAQKVNQVEIEGRVLGWLFYSLPPSRYTFEPIYLELLELDRCAWFDRETALFVIRTLAGCRLAADRRLEICPGMESRWTNHPIIARESVLLGDRLLGQIYWDSIPGKCLFEAAAPISPDWPEPPLLQDLEEIAWRSPSAARLHVRAVAQEAQIAEIRTGFSLGL